MEISVLVQGVLSPAEVSLPDPVPQLLRQAEKMPGVEILTFFDNGKVTPGAKRNHLMKQCRGKYLTFLDAGAGVSLAPDYLESLSRAVEMAPVAPDLVVFDHRAGERLRLFGLEYEWRETGSRETSPPEHGCLWRAALAVRHSFPDLEEKSEFFWGKEVSQEARTQIRINRPLYFTAAEKRV